MNNELYLVKHRYDVDGGYGDAVEQNELIAIFRTREDAEAFVKKFEDPHIYDTPYNDLRCGILYIEAMEYTDPCILDQDPKEFSWVSLPGYETRYNTFRCCERNLDENEKESRYENSL